MKLYFYGNCQAGALAKMVLEDHPKWTVDFLDVSSIQSMPEAVELHLGRIRKADIVVAQPVGHYRGEARLSLDFLRQTLRPSTQLVLFPSFAFEGTHGAFTYLDERLPSLGMPYHNAHTVDMLLRDYHWADIIRFQQSVDFYTAEFVLGGMEASLNTLRAREQQQQTTISMEAIARELCFSTVIVSAFNHPKRIVMARALNEIYRVLAMPRLAKEVGEEHLPNPVIPPLPSVLHHLGIADESPNFVGGLQTWSREAYLKETLSYYERLIRSDLTQAFLRSRGYEFIKAVYHGDGLSGAAAPGQMAHSVSDFVDDLIKDAFTVMMGREPASHELVDHAAYIKSMGAQAWLVVMTNAEEFKRRFGRDATA
jgi:hypothetical protein